MKTKSLISVYPFSIPGKFHSGTRQFFCQQVPILNVSEYECEIRNQRIKFNVYIEQRQRPKKTRMHSSRMRTAHSLPYGGRSLSGGVSVQGGSLSGGGGLCQGDLTPVKFRWRAIKNSFP